jgi:hypothetical protein
MEENMKKFSIMLLMLVMLTACTKAENTLQRAVQSQWQTPIEVLHQDDENQIVIYLDQTQYVIGVFEEKDGRYRYDNEQSEGMQSSAGIGAPFFVKHVYFEGKGDFLYGAVTASKKVEKVVLDYINGKTQELSAVNNTFIGDFPSFISDTNSLFADLENAYAYDKEGELVASILPLVETVKKEIDVGTDSIKVEERTSAGYKTLKLVDDPEELRKIEELLNDLEWERAEVEMTHPPEYRFIADNSFFAIWVTPNKDMLEMTVEGESLFIKLAEEESKLLFELVTGKNLDEE